MYDFKDPAGVARWATIALYLFMALDLVSAGTQLVEATRDFGALLGIPAFLAAILCYIFVGRWIYRTNANAHSFGTGDMTITPGWGVGWFFIPIANLFKPYEGVKETWRVSHEVGGLPDEADSSLLRWWWGLWIANSILGTVSFQLGGRFDEPLEGFYYANLLGALVNVPLSLVLIRLMNRLTHAQNQANAAEVFA